MDQKPLAFVVFGATGDLSQRKIMPALCALLVGHKVPQGSIVVAYSRRAWSDVEYRAFIEPTLHRFSAEEKEFFLQSVRYVQGTFDTKSFEKIKETTQGYSTMYHLAVQPDFYEKIINELGAHNAYGKILIEKPFGHDLVSAKKLEKTLEKFFLPKDIFRVDHYLAKSGIPLIQHIQKNILTLTCRILETIDISGRGEFYDATGALRDVGQNHLLEMLAVVLMSKDEADISKARARALEQLCVVSGSGVRAQYEGYAQEERVSEGSQTETYFSIQIKSSDVSWQNTVITLEAGKALGEKKNEIEVRFVDGSAQLLSMDIPGGMEAYEVLLEAAFRGEQNLFVSMPEVLAAWECAEHIEKELRQSPLRLYKKGITTLV